MNLQDSLHLRGLNAEQQMMFVTESGRQRKSETTAILLTLFLGGVGAHRFYLGQNGLGIVYAVFFWTFIPGIVAFFELFVISKRVRQYNERVNQGIATSLRFGRLFMSNNYCISCGTKLLEGARFCETCGKAVEAVGNAKAA